MCFLIGSVWNEWSTFNETFSREIRTLICLNEYVRMLIPNVCTHNHGYNRFSQNKLYINISQCDHANTSCVFAPWWLEETLFGFSWDRESEECRHQAAHAPPLNENFHFKRCGIPTCLSISVLSTVTWYSFLAQTKTVSWAYHKSLH